MTVPGRIATLVAVVAAVCGPGAPRATTTAIDLPVTLERVWYRAEDKPLFAAASISGDLTFSPEALEIRGRKREVVIPLRAVRGLSIGRMKGDVDTDWIVLEVDRGGAIELVGLRDGAKLGYGERTNDLYETLKAGMREIGVARYDVPHGYAAFEGLEGQLAFALPQGWSVYNLSWVEVDERTVLGATLFSKEPIALGEGDERDPQRVAKRLAAARRGEVPAFVLDRREPARGMRCEGFAPAGREEAAAWARERLAEGGLTVKQLDEPQPTEVGGCEGLRFRARLGGPDLVDDLAGEAVVVAGPRIAVAFVRRGADTPEHRDPFETALSTFRFAAAR